MFRAYIFFPTEFGLDHEPCSFFCLVTPDPYRASYFSTINSWKGKPITFNVLYWPFSRALLKPSRGAATTGIFPPPSLPRFRRKSDEIIDGSFSPDVTNTSAHEIMAGDKAAAVLSQKGKEIALYKG